MRQGARILVVDDEPQICKALEVHLATYGYSVIATTTAEQALHEFTICRPDAVLIDLLLPGMDGIEATRQIRCRSSVPIIVVSAVSAEGRKVQALELGADDYITKPFSPVELVARIKSVLRRVAGAKDVAPVVHVGDLSVNFETREVRLSGEPIRLTPTEFDLLKFMIQNAGKVLTHRMLLTAVWGESYSDQAQYLRVFVGHLRKKLEKNPARPRYIVTDLGVGYRFVIDWCDTLAKSSSSTEP